MRIKLVHKFTVGICLIIIALTVALSVIGDRMVRKAISRKVTHSLRSVEEVFRNYQNLRLQDLKDNAALVSEIPQVKALAMTEGIDHLTVFDSLKSIHSIIDSDLFILFDGRGKLLASITEPSRYGDDYSDIPVFSLALKGKPFDGVLVQENKTFQVVITPLTIQNKIVGAILIGFEIDQDLIDNLAKMTSAQVALYVGGKKITSSDSENIFLILGDDFLKEELKTQEISSHDINGENFMFSKILLDVNLPTEFYILGRSLDKEMAFYRELKGVLFIVICIVLLYAVCFGVLYSTKITKPVKDLVEGVEKVAEGDLNARVKVRSNDEIGNLALSFNRMASELKSTQDKLYQSEKLKMVGQLSAGVAHEVKNPLAVLMMGTDYVSRNVGQDNPKVIRMLEDMKHATQRADLVIKGLLDLSSVSELTLGSVNIHEALDESALMVKYELDQHKVRLEKKYGEDIPPLKLDKTKMEQVFINTMINSAQAMENGGTITVSTFLSEVTEDILAYNERSRGVLNPGEQALFITIEDDGPGIPQEVLDNIFEPFFTTKKGKGGSGLGMSIITNIMELHKGAIIIRNRENGTGAMTTIVLGV